MPDKLLYHCTVRTVYTTRNYMQSSPKELFSNNTCRYDYGVFGSAANILQTPKGTYAISTDHTWNETQDISNTLSLLKSLFKLTFESSC